MPKAKKILKTIETLSLTRGYIYKRELIEAIIEAIEMFKVAYGPKASSIDCIPSTEDNCVCKIVIKGVAKSKKLTK